MGILEHSSNYQNFIKNNNIIPDYARDYKNEYLFIIYIEDTIMRLKNKHEENWGKIVIYEFILNLVNFIIKYFNNPSKDRLKIVDWYFIDLIINKDKIIFRGFL